MNKKKIIYSILLIILISLVLLIFNAFNGNPLSKFIGENITKKYLEETYPGEEFRVESGEYNFKFGEYNYDVIKIGEDPYAIIDSTASQEDKEKQYQQLDYYITVNGIFKPRVGYDSIKYARIDEKLSEKLSEEASNEIEALLKEEISTLVSTYVDVEVSKFTLPSDTTWSKDLNLDYPINLDILLDGTDLNPKEALAEGIKLQQFLNDNEFEYAHVNINANIFDKNSGEKDHRGYVKYGFAFTPETKLTLKDVEEFNKDLK